MRIPSPQLPLWTRCWQPIGTTVMDTEVLKEPRGFIRCLQWLFALVAFATCANFSTNCGYTVTCKDTTLKPIRVDHPMYYPFKLDSVEPKITNPNGNTDVSACFDKDKAKNQPGDFSSDAQFFVFTGVVAWLGATGSLIIYVFFSQKYLDDDKKVPMIDFCFTVIVAVFWLSASAAWANGVLAMKSAADESWLWTSTLSPCQKENNEYIKAISECSKGDDQKGSYGGANAAVLLGFLNFFLWASNLWFIYIETKWFANRSQNSNQPQQMES